MLVTTLSRFVSRMIKSMLQIEIAEDKSSFTANHIAAHSSSGKILVTYQAQIVLNARGYCTQT